MRFWAIYQPDCLPMLISGTIPGVTMAEWIDMRDEVKISRAIEVLGQAYNPESIVEIFFNDETAPKGWF